MSFKYEITHMANKLEAMSLFMKRINEGDNAECLEQAADILRGAQRKIERIEKTYDHLQNLQNFMIDDRSAAVTPAETMPEQGEL